MQFKRAGRQYNINFKVIYFTHVLRCQVAVHPYKKLEQPQPGRRQRLTAPRRPTQRSTVRHSGHCLGHEHTRSPQICIRSMDKYGIIIYFFLNWTIYIRILNKLLYLDGLCVYQFIHTRTSSKVLEVDLNNIFY